MLLANCQVGGCQQSEGEHGDSDGPLFVVLRGFFVGESGVGGGRSGQGADDDSDGDGENGDVFASGVAFADEEDRQEQGGEQGSLEKKRIFIRMNISRKKILEVQKKLTNHYSRIYRPPESLEF